MTSAEIRGKFYDIYNEWSDITLDQFIKLCDIEIPEKLLKLWRAETDEEYDRVKVEPEDVLRTFPDYFGKVIKVLTSIPEEIVDLMDGALREQFFNFSFRHFVLSIGSPLPFTLEKNELIEYEPPYLESFEVNGETYFLPRTLRVFGEDVPLAEEHIMTFAEASAIELAWMNLANDVANRIPAFVALYCRKEGEGYNEKEVLKREKLFRYLKMNIVWRLFFCITELKEKYEISTLQYLRGVTRIVDESVRVD